MAIRVCKFRYPWIASAKNLFKSVVLCLILALCVFFAPEANASTEDLLYLATWNAGTTRLSTVWQYQIGMGNANPIFTLPNTTQAARDLFSPNELSALQAYDKETGTLRGNLDGQYPPAQTIENLWRFDPTRLLLLTDNEVLDTLTAARFGYHEFLLLDFLNKTQPRSLIKIDYHDPIAHNWRCQDFFVQPQIVELNPQRQMFAVTLSGNSCSTIAASSTLLVDFTESAVHQTLIPLADNPSWSPDGSELAYLQTQCSSDKTCSATLQIRSVMDGGITTVNALQNGLDFNPHFGRPVWMDSSTLLYRWYPQPNEDPGAIYERYNVDTTQNTLFSYNENIGIRSFYNLHDASNIALIAIGDNYSAQKSTGFFMDSSFPYSITNSIDTDRAYEIYNSRYPDRLILLEPTNNPKTPEPVVVIVEANKNIERVPLTGTVPSEEWIGNSIAS